MHHPVLVGVVQGVGHVRDQLGRFVKGETAGGEPLGQRGALDKLADEVTRRAAGTRVIDGYDAGVLQPGGAAGFAEEMVQVFLRRHAPGPGHFDGHDAVQFHVPGLVDGAEPAGPEPF